MKKDFPGGVWPTMLTPFTETNKIDYPALERLIEWYLKNQVDGLFAVCQSSEMFYLSLEERVELARFVNSTAAGRVPVIASGHISEDIDEAARELNLIAETRVQAVILITNRLAGQDDPDEVFRKNLEKLLAKIPEDVCLGFYECPYPYKRIISPEILKWCADTGRFFFLKDTSCDVENISGKLEAVKGSSLKIYNANTATLLETLGLGAAGFSGVMANFHPDLYVWLTRNWSEKYEDAKHLSDFLSVASQIERQLYPVNAKYSLTLEGILTNYFTRSKDPKDFTSANRKEVEQLRDLSLVFSNKYRI
jgi:4-hydroxy-tetrahydrodipicolinate synthase